ncbi:MAG: ABC transporter substrate-binding protein [Lachnospiraceae bacterium]|nr:ABC transporter substrate-binding protein [Lachnospiraceae bacterium]
MKKKLISLFLMTSVLAIALCGCAGDKKGDDSSITIGIPQDLEDGLDPHKVEAAGTKEVLFNIFEGLVKPTSDGDFIPAVASAYEISEDGRTYTFTVRDNVKFHDGSKLKTSDVKYSIDRCAGLDGGTPLVAAFSNIEETVADGQTFTVKLKEPDTEFIAYMTAAIIPEANKTPDTNPIGTGPYKFVSRSPQENFIIKKFDDYYNKDLAAHIENVTFKVIGNPDTLAMEMNSGAIDLFARIPTAQAELLDDRFEIMEETMNLVQALYINNAVEPFDDVRVRQALCYAIDPKEIMLFVSDGKGTEIGSSMFPAFSKYYMPELNDTYNQDLDKAKALLEEAGYPDGFTFDITVASNYTQHVDTAQVLKQEFEKIGVTANIKLVEWDSWLSDVYNGRNYTTTVVGVDASSLTASALLERFTSASSKNFINYSNPDYDAAFANAKKATDDDEKTGYYKECLKILSEDAANVYIQDLPEFVALNKKYTGYEFYPLYVQDISKIRLAE